MPRIEFTKEMKKTHTILLPNMLPIHFELLQGILADEGYKVALLKNNGPTVVTEGLKYVHNDTCYPALLVIGQMLDALNSGQYDLAHTALMITQTGGGCRASNYIHLLRKALIKAGYEYIPVVSLNLSGLEKNEGFHLTLPMLQKMIAAVAYGDLIMLLSNQTRPYEQHLGDTDALVRRCVLGLAPQLRAGIFHSNPRLRANLNKIAAAFAAVPTTSQPKTKVGIVGEIYVKYASLGNNNLEAFLRSQNCEVMIPGLLSFLLFKFDNRLEDIKLYGGSLVKKEFVTVLMGYLFGIESAIRDAVHTTHFVATSTYRHLKSLVGGVIGYGNKMGEGWLLTAEMLELVELGYENIVCTQPFGCLPNHVVGRGMLKKIKSLHPNANIVPIDYDPSATRVNQENRIKLMLAMAAQEETTEEPVPATCGGVL
ncbi:MAG: 2-hydroxyacyl-CoA dehydratase [Angelakisella sp.]